MLIYIMYQLGRRKKCTVTNYFATLNKHGMLESKASSFQGSGRDRGLNISTLTNIHICKKQELANAIDCHAMA